MWLHGRCEPPPDVTAKSRMAYLAEQQQLVQALVQAGAGLVDGGDDGTPSRSQLPQNLNTVHGCGGVQACSDQPLLARPQASAGLTM